MIPENVDVSVVLVTYNHEPFIVQAIESVLAQEDVQYELLISEDCSTDRTGEIVVDYARRYPSRIRLFRSPENLNTNEVLSRAIEAACGRYVALLDGDDYWTSTRKLRTQVDYLDAHRECAICFHNAMVTYEDGTPPHPFHMAVPTYKMSHPLPRPVSTLADVAPGNFMQTCSVIFRRGLFGRFPSWYAGFAVGDWPLHVLNAEHGDIGYLDEIMAAYRVHSGGLWSTGMSRYTRREYADGFAEAYRILNDHLDGRFADEFGQRVTLMYLDAAATVYAAGRTRDALYYVRRYMARLPLRERLLPRRLVRTLLATWRKSKRHQRPSVRTGAAHT